MAVINRRNRLVNFRLSEQELDHLKSMCHSNGSRSISDFARSAVLRSLETAALISETPQHRIQHLDEKVNELEARLSLLVQLMELRQQGPRDPIGFAQSA